MSTSLERRVATLAAEVAALERFFARRMQMMDGLDWSAFTKAFCHEAAVMDDHLSEEIALRVLEIEHLEKLPDRIQVQSGSPERRRLYCPYCA